LEPGSEADLEGALPAQDNDGPVMPEVPVDAPALPDVAE